MPLKQATCDHQCSGRFLKRRSAPNAVILEVIRFTHSAVREVRGSRIADSVSAGKDLNVNAEPDAASGTLALP